MKTGKIPGVSRPVPRLILDCADAPALADALRAGVGAVLLPADLPLPDAPEPGPVVLRRGGEHPLPADVTLWREDPPARGVYGGAGRQIHSFTANKFAKCRAMRYNILICESAAILREGGRLWNSRNNSL